MPTPEPTTAAPASDTKVTVETRLGPIEFDATNIVTLPQGLLGYQEHQQFGLAMLPEEKFGRFMLLQSLDDPEVSFPLLPLEFLPDAIEQADVDEARESLGIAAEDTAVLLITTIRKVEDGVSLSVNLRAPLVLDTKRRIGRQVVLSNAEYSIRHPL